MALPVAFHSCSSCHNGVLCVCVVCLLPAATILAELPYVIGQATVFVPIVSSITLPPLQLTLTVPHICSAVCTCAAACKHLAMVKPYACPVELHDVG